MIGRGRLYGVDHPHPNGIRPHRGHGSGNGAGTNGIVVSKSFQGHGRELWSRSRDNNPVCHWNARRCLLAGSDVTLWRRLLGGCRQVLAYLVVVGAVLDAQQVDVVYDATSTHVVPLVERPDGDHQTGAVGDHHVRYLHSRVNQLKYKQLN